MSKAIHISILVCLLTACGVPALSTPAPTPQAIYVTLPQDLQPWGKMLSACAASNPLAAIYSQPYPPASNEGSELSPNDIVFSLGEPAQYGESAVMTQVGKEKLVVIVNRLNEVSQLSTSQLGAIFSGQTTNWKSSSGDTVRPWVLPPDDPVRIIFDRAAGISNLVATNAMVAPSVQAMLEAVAGDKNSIGYLTGTLFATGDPSLTRQVKIVDIDGSLEAELSQPVIALTREEPVGVMRELLVCLQSKAP